MHVPMQSSSPRLAVRAALALGVSCLAVAPASHAQGSQQTGLSRTGMLEEVTVTAQKREQRLQEVPISIAVVEGSVIADRSIENFEEFSAFIPNFSVVRSPGANAIFMRGIGSGPGSPSLDQSVVMFIDGVYGGRSRQFAVPFLDLERIEVLRGPQGALVGKNTSAGAINIVTARPSDEFQGEVGVEYDFELEGPTLTGMLTGPVSDRVKLRGAVRYQDVDGFLKNTISGNMEPGREERLGRLVGTYEGDTVTVTGKYEVARLELDGNPQQIIANSIGRSLDYVKETGSAAGREFDTNDADNAALTIDWQIGDHTLTFITGYSEYKTRQGTDADFFERDLAYSTFDEDFDQISQEIRLLSPTGRTFDYVVGIYAHSADLLETRTTTALFAPGTNSIRYFDQSTDTYSLYGQLTWNLSEQFSLIGSLRYTEEDKDATYRRVTGPLAPSQGIGAVTADFGDSLKEEEIDPAISLQWTPDDGRMIYLSYAQGSKSGGFQGAIPNATASAFEFAPEKSESFELGYKQSLAGRGYFDIVLFDTTYEDLQVSVAIQSNPAVSAFAFYTGNAAKASATGIESTFGFRFTDSFRIQGSLAYIDGEFDDYPNGPCGTGQPPDDPIRNSCNLTGVALPFAPKWSGNVTAYYDAQLTDRWRFDVSATAIFRDDTRTEFPNDPQFVQKSYIKYDMRLGLTYDERWEVALLGRNLTDEQSFSFSGTGSLAANPVFGIAPDARIQASDLPRTIALQVRGRF
jgi:iron complex outermembrane receptor protein